MLLSPYNLAALHPKALECLADGMLRRRIAPLHPEDMTIIAQLQSLEHAYAGMEALRSKQIPPALSKDGEYLMISVEDDFAANAIAILAADGRFAEHHLSQRRSGLPGFEDCNA